MEIDTFGQRLKILREEKNINQIQLAKDLGVGKSIISLWERNECEPTLSNLKTMALFFGISVDYLVGLKDY